MVCRTTPSPPQEPGPSCQAGLTVLPGPELRPPLLCRGSHTRGCHRATHACRGRSPPLTPRDLLLLLPGQGACGPSCALQGCGQTGDPQALRPAPASSEGPAPQQVLRRLLPPLPSSWACLASTAQPFAHQAGMGAAGNTRVTWTARGGQLGVVGHPGCRPRHLQLPLPRQHVACVWGGCGSFMYTHVGDSVAGHTYTVSAQAALVWAPRLSALKPGSPCTWRVPSAPAARCGAAMPSPGQALHPCGRLSPRKVGAAIWVLISQGG